MNTSPGLLLLILTPLLPLLLAFPALHSRIFRPCHAALVPPLLLLTLPAGTTVELPWLLLGSGLAIHDQTDRLLLAMSVLLWGAAALFLHTTGKKEVDHRLTTCFMLALSGNMGMILATGMADFFAFSVLTGYAFYGLLVAGRDTEEIRRAARIYLVCLILADLALFEALLIAAATTGSLEFGAVHHVLARSSSIDLYLSMVLAGFALKAALWPLHFWLPPAFRSARPGVAILLGGVPVAVGLLTAMRWLPLGEVTRPDLALLVQGMGIAAMLYASVAGVVRAQPKTVTAYVVVAATGLFTFVLGTGLADPAAWSRHEKWVYILVVFLGIGPALLVVTGRWLEDHRHASCTIDNLPDTRLERCFRAALYWGTRTGTDTLPRLRAACLARASRLWQPRSWHRFLDGSERFLQRWAVAITLFLLLGVAVVFFSMSS